jgi:hypothetical protein
MPDYKKKYRKYKKKYRDLVDKLNRQNNTMPLRILPSPIRVSPSYLEPVAPIRLLPTPAPFRIVPTPAPFRIVPIVLSPFINRKYSISALFDDIILLKLRDIITALKNKYPFGIISSDSDIKLAQGQLKNGSEESLRNYVYSNKDFKYPGTFKNVEISNTSNKTVIKILVDCYVLSNMNNYFNGVISNEVNSNLCVNLLTLRPDIIPSLEDVKIIINSFGLEGSTFQIKDFQINKI